jgi:LPXTG-site transpeptidase (sortase) family protein
MANPTKFPDSLISWLRKRMLPIGLATLLLGVAGVSVELIGAGDDELPNDVVVYASGMGFVPSLILADPASAAIADSADPSLETSSAAAFENDNAAQASTALATSLLGGIPDRIMIPSIGLYAPIVPVDKIPVELDGDQYYQWLAPRGYRAGWHTESSLLGIGGNTVINGHHNAYGEVFRDLIEIQENDLIILSSGDNQFFYQVAAIAILEERFASVEERLANASWIGPTDDERLTLITCWPETSNTHRLIVVAEPLPMPDIDQAG